MPRTDADRNVLPGIRALQMDFVARDELIAAMNSWVIETHRPLGDILADRGAPSPEDRAAPEAGVDRNVARHGGNPARSLAALGPAGDAVEALRRSAAGAPGSFGPVYVVGEYWWMGGMHAASSNHTMPPDSKLCTSGDVFVGNTGDTTAYGPSSYHAGGVNVAFDGSVRFVKGSVSPKAWWAPSTGAGGEIINASSY